jgi:hypothetical protein
MLGGSVNFMPSVTVVAQAGIGLVHLLNLYQAHAAVGRYRQFLVIAKVRDIVMPA